MRWLIVEDSLEGRHGHWFEYLSGFHHDLPVMGDSVTWLVSKMASQEVVSHFAANPILPESIYLKMSDGAQTWRRYSRIPIHAWRTFRAMRKFLKSAPDADVIFVPTVIVHHLLGWFLLIKTTVNKQKTRVLLFFPSLPIYKDDACVRLDGSPTARLMKWLFQHLGSKIQHGKVILGVETDAMKRAAEEVFGVPFTYFPHPVKPIHESKQARRKLNGDLIMACYGDARYEKGSDLVVTAVEKYLTSYPKSKLKFVIQWIDGVSLPDGSRAEIPETLRSNPRVEIIDRLFRDEEYETYLQLTNVLFLPYRKSTYNLRVSRVVIEGLVNGIPIVTTMGTTLAEQASKYGVCMICEEGELEDLVLAIKKIEDFSAASDQLLKTYTHGAITHFSVSEFRSHLLL